MATGTPLAARLAGLGIAAVTQPDKNARCVATTRPQRRVHWRFLLLSSFSFSVMMSFSHVSCAAALEGVHATLLANKSASNGNGNEYTSCDGRIATDCASWSCAWCTLLNACLDIGLLCPLKQPVGQRRHSGILRVPDRSVRAHSRLVYPPGASTLRCLSPCCTLRS